MTSQEDSDLAKAIALSLKEAEGRKSPKKSKLYPSANEALSHKEPTELSKAYGKSSLFQEPRKVKALYDFEAAEDNELTFKAGEVVSVLDDSDPNWWRGSTWRGEGLFPANFVTSDLTAEIESETAKTKKSVSFDTEVKVVEAPPVLEIDEEKINETLDMIQNVDPTAEIDPNNLLQYEEQCRLMAPLIDQGLEQVDRHHLTLMDLNSRLSEAFQMYTSLMNPTSTHLLPQSTHLPPQSTHFSPPSTHRSPPTTHYPSPSNMHTAAYNSNFNNSDYQYNGQYQMSPYSINQQQQQIDSTTTLMENTTISDQQSSFQQQQQQPFNQSYMNGQTTTANLI